MAEIAKFDGLKVFSATKALEREQLGEKITEWMSKNPKANIIDKVITQSSDNEFHCLTIILFFRGTLDYNPAPQEKDRNQNRGGRFAHG